MAENESRRVLDDHKRVGQRFIPPFLQLGKWTEANWAGRILPELVWIALIHEEHGLKCGAELALALAKEASQTTESCSKPWFGSVSSFSSLPDAVREGIRDHLDADGKRVALCAALRPLVTFYPECPLSFLFEESERIPVIGRDLPRLKGLIRSHFDRTGTPATMTQASAVYIAFVTDKLKVAAGLSLAEFPEIEAYPGTEKSQRVAASVRSVVNMFVSPPSYDLAFSWPGYFWNTGLRLEACQFSETSE